MEINEKDLYEAFGLDIEEGAEDAELADPQIENDEAEGGEEQELTDPAEDFNEEDDETDEADSADDDNEQAEDDAESDDAGTPKGKNAQSPEERAHHAAIRRRAELEAKVSAARTEAEERAAKEFEELLRLNPIKDPKTGKDITTLEEYRAAKASFEEKKQTDILKKSGMSREELDGYISDLPEVKAAREEAARAREASAKAQIDSDIAEISKYDPTIRSIEDLAKSESYSAIYDRVANHNDTLLDAYKFVHSEAIAKRNLEAARNAERQKAAGKAHLQRTAARGSGAVSVPGEVMAFYREMNPGVSDAEIAKHYQKAQKGSN